MLPPAVQREDAPDDPVAAKLECMTLNGAGSVAESAFACQIHMTFVLDDFCDVVHCTEAKAGSLGRWAQYVCTMRGRVRGASCSVWTYCLESRWQESLRQAICTRVHALRTTARRNSSWTEGTCRVQGCGRGR